MRVPNSAQAGGVAGNWGSKDCQLGRYGSVPTWLTKLGVETPALQAWGPRGRGLGRGCWDCPAPQGTVRGPSSLAARLQRLRRPALTLVSFPPRCEACELFTRAQLSLAGGWVREEGLPALPVGNSIPPREAVGGLGPWQWQAVEQQESWTGSGEGPDNARLHIGVSVRA